MSGPSPKSAADTSPRRLRAYAAGAAVSVVFLVLLVTSIMGVGALSGIRGFVLGEGLWAKAQKRAVVALQTYVRTGDPAEYEMFETEIGITLSDRTARLELLKDDPDVDVIREGFLGGEIPEPLIDDMIRVVRLGRGLDFVEATLDIWALGDSRIEDLVEEAEALRAVRSSPEPDEALVAASLDRILEIDAELTDIERSFSETYNAGALRVERALRVMLALLGLGVALTAVASYGAITGHLRANQAVLARSEARYRELFERNVLGAALVSDDGHFVEVNEAFAEIMGYDAPEELAGLSTAVCYLEPETRDEVRGELLDEGRLTTREVEVRRKDGTATWILATSVTLPPSEQHRAPVLSMAWDISAQKALEVELNRARRMEALGQVAGGVAHDFNNLLTVIQGNATLAMEQAVAALDGKDSVDTDLLEEIQTSAEAAAALTQQLLAFSRGEAPDVAAEDLNGVVERHVGLLGRLLPTSIECRVALAEDLPPVGLSRAHLDQIVLNLTLNARDAMPSGGVLELRTRLVASEDSGVYVELCVADTGVGMEPKIVSRIFEPFFSTKKVGRGTGMGLATLHGIIERIGGRVSVDSTLGEGSTFRVLLPAAVDGAVMEQESTDAGGDSSADAAVRPGPTEPAAAAPTETAAAPATESVAPSTPDLVGIDAAKTPEAAATEAPPAEAPSHAETQPPSADATPADSSASPAAPQPPQTGAGPLILLVDDTDQVRKFAGRVLERAGYRVLEAEDGPAGLRAFAVHGLEIALVVSDIVMPGMEGPEMVREMRKSRPKLPVVYVSGFTNQALGGDQLSLANTDFLAKPFRPAELRDMVDGVLDRAMSAGSSD